MTFLNPVLLFAMAAATIPLLLHLLNLRKLRTVEFSSLRFLKELQKTRIRRLKLKQILLLLLRTGLIVFAVLAFARPALEGASGLPGSHAATTAVILLDDSYSMAVRDERGTRFNQAREAVGELVDLFEDNDEAYLVSMTALEDAATAEPSRNGESLKRRLDEMSLSYRRADLGGALRVAGTLLQQSGNLNREVYIVTDAQRANLLGDADSLRIFDEQTRIYLMPIGAESGVRQTNLGLDSIRMISTIFEQGKPVDVRAWVRNYSERPVEDAVVSMYIGENRVAQSTISAGAGESVVVDLTAPLKTSGLVSGRIQIEGDDFEADNRRWFSFRLLDRVQLALVPNSETVRYLKVALGLTNAAFAADEFAPASLPAVDLAKYSALVLADVPTISGGDASRLAEYVKGGGGLVIYGGPSVDRNNFNTTLGPEVGIGIGVPEEGVGEGGQSLRFSSVERGHPIFAGVFDPVRAGNVVGAPDIARLLPPAGGETVIRMSNGSSFLSEFRFGRGKIIYVSVPPNLTWSDFPFSDIFVPIAIRSILYVGVTGEAFQQTTVGESIVIDLPGRANLPEQVKVTPPGGQDRFVPVRRLPSGTSIRVDDTDEPGIYRISSGSEGIALFSVNMGSGESDLQQMEPEEFREAVARHMLVPDNLTTLQPTGGEFADAIVESRFGLELWKYMLALALLCAFAEMLVGRAAKESPSG